MSAYSRQVEEERQLERKYRAAKRERATQSGAKGVPRKTEARYRAQREDAAKRRRQAAREVDAASREHGETLGWYATIDENTTSECLAAHGSNFRVGAPPAIGYPGTVHARCRCRPGPPHRGAPLMSNAAAKQRPDNMNNFLRGAIAGARSAARQATRQLSEAFFGKNFGRR